MHDGDHIATLLALWNNFPAEYHEFFFEVLKGFVKENGNLFKPSFTYNIIY